MKNLLKLTCRLTIAFLFVFILPAFSAKDSKKEYKTQWEEVENAEKREGFEAERLVEAILERAVKDENTIQQLKANIFLMKYALYKNKGVVFKQFEKYIPQIQDIGGRALAHSMMAEVYLQYYNSYSFKINKVVSEPDTISDDIDLWTKDIYQQKIFEHLRASLPEEQILETLKLTSYLPLLESGSSGKYVYLFDYLSDRLFCMACSAIEFLDLPVYNTLLEQERWFVPANDFINLSFPVKSKFDIGSLALRSMQRQLFFSREKQDTKHFLKMDLKRLRVQVTPDLQEKYLSILDNFIKQYADHPYVAEIYYVKYLLLQNDIVEKENIHLEAKAIAKRFADYEEGKKLEKLISTFEHPSCELRVPEFLSVGESAELKLEYKSIQKCKIEIYQISDNGIDYEVKRSEILRPMKDEYIRKENLKYTLNIDLPDFSFLCKKDTTIILPPLSTGRYALYLSVDKAKELGYFIATSVIEMLPLSRQVGKNMMKVMVYDRITGQLLPEVQVNLYKEEKIDKKSRFNKILELKTDDSGTVSFNKEKDEQLYYTLSNGNEKEIYLYKTFDSYWYIPKDNKKQVDLFTDRSIYRPGQTLYFKGIAYHEEQKSLKLDTGKSYRISLENKRNEQIGDTVLNTNEFGSFHGSFVLSDALTDQNLTISVDSQVVRTVIVEQYKCPVFDITFNVIDSIYLLGEQIKLNGNVRNNDGLPASNMAFSYDIFREVLPSVVRRQVWHRNLVTGGVFETDKNGNFTISFNTKHQHWDNTKQTVVFDYFVNINFGNSSQHKLYSVRVGTHLYSLKIEGEETVKGVTPYIFRATDLKGLPADVPFKWQVYSLKDYKTLKASLDRSVLENDKLLLEGQGISNKEIKLPLDRLTPGNYRVCGEIVDEKGKCQAFFSKDILLFDPGSSKMPFVAYQWVNNATELLNHGESATILYGTSAEDVCSLYELFDESGKLLDSKLYRMNNEVIQIIVPFREEYGDKVVGRFTFVKDGMMFDRGFILGRNEKNKELKLGISSFRDKLRSDADEIWSLHVENTKGDAEQAEVLVTMYDSSLDNSVTNQWNFEPAPEYVNNITYWSTSGRWGKERLVLSFDEDIKSHTHPESYQSWFELLHKTSDNVSLRTMGSYYRTRFRRAWDNLEGLTENIWWRFDNRVSVLNDDLSFSSYKRMQETAFFYPNLQTNEQGNVKINIVLPEGETTANWKLMGLAHTKDMEYGGIEKELAILKKLKVTSNLPDSFLSGKTAEISARIDNLYACRQEIKVELELFDPSTGKLILPKQLKTISIGKNENAFVNWKIVTPQNTEIVGVRIKAYAGDFSDGEQYLLPVIP